MKLYEKCSAMKKKSDVYFESYYKNGSNSMSITASQYYNQFPLQYTMPIFFFCKSRNTREIYDSLFLQINTRNIHVNIFKSLYLVALCRPPPRSPDVHSVDIPEMELNLSVKLYKAVLLQKSGVRKFHFRYHCSKNSFVRMICKSTIYGSCA